MDPCGCDEFASIFDARNAERDRDRYRKDGPDRSTAMLLDLIRRHGVAGATVLDVGGGIGVIDQELLRSGAGRAVLVDASRASLQVARDEANRANVLDRMEIAEGDMVRLAPQLDDADIVTLDRVVCCYRDPVSLVGVSGARARRLMGIVLPKDRLLIRVGLRIMNVVFRLRRSAYRAYAHPNRLVDELAAEQGLHPAAETGTFFWRVVLYARADAAA